MLRQEHQGKFGQGTDYGKGKGLGVGGVAVKPGGHNAGAECAPSVVGKGVSYVKKLVGFAAGFTPLVIWKMRGSGLSMAS